MRDCAAPVEVHAASTGVVSDEARKRADPSASPDQDQWRLASGRSERGVLADEGLDPTAGFELVQKTRTLATRMFAHADLSHAIAVGGRKRIKPR